MGLVAPGANQRPRGWIGRTKQFVNRMLGRFPDRFRLKISHQERYGPAPVYQQKLEQFWSNQVQQTNLVPALCIFFICVIAMLLTLGPLGVENPLQNLWVEFGGLTFDILFILVIFSLFENGRQNRESIERQKEIIGDYKFWDSEEARFRIAGALRRLNKRGIHAIDFSGAKLSDFTFSKNGIESIRGSNFFDGVWGDFFKDSRVKLQRVDFSFLDCRNVMFSPFDPLSGLVGGGLRHTHLTDCTFIQSKLQGASFKGAALKWTKAPPDDLYEYFEEEDGQYNGSSQIHYGPFDEADLSGASFVSVVFENADFRNAEGILKADFAGAKGLEQALFDTEQIKNEVLKIAKLR